ncbi:MAG: sigma-54-dependent transcriptional regulator [Ignavibacteria bacterium]
MEKILIIDDNEYIRYTLTALLKDAGFDAGTAEDGTAGIEEVKTNLYSLVILDLKLPRMDGMEILKKIRELRYHIPVIMLTAFGDIKSAVEAMKHGAQDFITKPFDNDAIVMTIRKTLEVKYLNEEINLLRKKVDESYKKGELIGSGEKMKEIYDKLNLVAPTPITVLLEGESGTGKEVIANLIHRLSDRANKPFIAVDCGAIPDTLIESELFGHEKGAYTDAKSQKEGKFVQANEGTIFLDEVTNLSDANQMKLLRVIESRTITPLGSNKPMKLNVRIICASNIRLSDSVNNKLFRQDLYYRLNEFRIELPPLRDRKEDIPQFIGYFIKDANTELNKNIQSVNPGVLEKILCHPWPGNARELRNVIRRAVLLTHGEIITSVDIPDEIINISYVNSDGNSKPASISDSTSLLEKELIIKALNEAGGNKSKAAKILNMNERTLYRRIKKLGIV